MSDITVEQYSKAAKGSVAVYLVKRAGNVIGTLQKYADTRTDKHPWKAFDYNPKRPANVPAECLGMFYAADGGKQAAIAAITNR